MIIQIYYIMPILDKMIVKKIVVHIINNNILVIVYKDGFQKIRSKLVMDQIIVILYQMKLLLNYHLKEIHVLNSSFLMLKLENINLNSIGVLKKDNQLINVKLNHILMEDH